MIRITDLKISNLGGSQRFFAILGVEAPLAKFDAENHREAQRAAEIF